MCVVFKIYFLRCSLFTSLIDNKASLFQVMICRLLQVSARSQMVQCSAQEKQCDRTKTSPLWYDPPQFEVFSDVQPQTSFKNLVSIFIHQRLTNSYLNTSRPRQDGHHFADDNSFFDKNCYDFNHICCTLFPGFNSEYTSIGSDNDLTPNRQAIIWVTDDLDY